MVRRRRNGAFSPRETALNRAWLAKRLQGERNGRLLARMKNCTRLRAPIAVLRCWYATVLRCRSGEDRRGLPPRAIRQQDRSHCRMRQRDSAARAPARIRTTATCRWKDQGSWRAPDLATQSQSTGLRGVVWLDSCGSRWWITSVAVRTSLGYLRASPGDGKEDWSTTAPAGASASQERQAR